MRLLLTTDTVGGVWTFTRELTRELLHLGHSVALVSFGRLPSGEQSQWCTALAATHPDSFRYDASPAPLEWMEHNDTAYIAGESVLLRVAAEFSPDVLHSNQFCFGRLPLPVPRLITAHSDVLSWAEACRPEGLEASPWLTTCCRLTQEGLLAADAVVAPTLWMLKALARNFDLPCTQHVILNGRTLPEHDHSAAPSRRLQAVSVGRLWDEAKNLSLLTGLDSPFPILIAGEDKLDGHGAFAPARPAGSEQVQALGFLDEPQLLTLFRSSSLYIAAAIYEPFGLAALEAALCGCAILAHDIPSLREVWGDSALYFSSHAALEKLLEDLNASPALLEAAQARSLRRARQLTAETMTANYVHLYESLLRRETSSSRSLRTQSARPPLASAETSAAVPDGEEWLTNAW